MKTNRAFKRTTILLILFLSRFSPIAYSFDKQRKTNASQVSYTLTTRPARDKRNHSILVWSLQNTGKKAFEMAEGFSPWTLNSPQTFVMAVSLQGVGTTYEPIGIPPGKSGFPLILVQPQEIITRVVDLNDVFPDFDAHLKESTIVVFWAHTLKIKDRSEWIIPSVKPVTSGSSIYKKR